jgi:RNA polymerase sigma factor (sigma-70 family)
MRTVIRHLRRAALLQAGDSLTDGQLLDSFLGQRDEAVFEALLRRHGRMVLGVCRRVLGNSDDADDAFQATFLVLVRKAATVRPRELVGSWLYGVAYRTALKARALNAKRRTKEKLARQRPPPESPGDEVPDELLARLDAELNRLPDKYRVPVVLCDLQGKTRKEAARILGVPEGTLSWRLAQAKKLLARRLSQYGVALSATLLVEGAASAVPSPSLITATVKVGLLVATGQAATAGAVPAQVLALAEGVMKVMLLSKLRVAAWVIVLAVCVGGGAAYRAAAQGPVQGRFVATDGAGQNAPDDLDAIRLEMEALRKEVRALRERVKTLEAQAGALKGGGQAPVLSLDTTGQFKDVTVETKIYRFEKPSRAGADPLAEAEAALKKLRKNPNDKEAADALGRALQQIRSGGLNRKQQAPPSGGGLPPEAKTGAGVKASQATQAPAAQADRITFLYTPTTTFEMDPVATAEVALKKLRANPGDQQAADALERALKRLKEQRKPAGGSGNVGK